MQNTVIIDGNVTDHKITAFLRISKKIVRSEIFSNENVKRKKYFLTRHVPNKNISLK